MADKQKEMALSIFIILGNLFYFILVHSQGNNCVSNLFRFKNVISGENKSSHYERSSSLLSEFPKLSVHRSCISEKQRKELLHLAALRLTSETDSGFSSSLYLRNADDAKIEILKDITKLAGHVSGLPWQYAEPISLTKYTMGQNYGLHYDSGFVMNCRKTFRQATFLLYLNSVEHGGETVFPFGGGNKTHILKVKHRRPIQEVCEEENGLKVAPESGTCIVFSNHVGGNPDVDPLSLHGACPVVSGEKWIVQVWLHNSPWQNKTDSS